MSDLGPKDERVGRLCLYGVRDMSDVGRKEVADWLRRTASHIEHHGPEYTQTRFTANLEMQRRNAVQCLREKHNGLKG